MHSKARLPHVIFGASLRPESAAVAILFLLLFLLLVFLFMNFTAQPVWGQSTQNAVPPTAREAAASPAFASRLHSGARPAAPDPHPSASPQDNVIYSNGMCDLTKRACNAYAWTLNFGYAVSDSFTMGTRTSVSGFDFVAWAIPGDKITSIDWSITNAPFGGTVYSSGTATTMLSKDQGTNDYGYDIQNYRVSGLNVALSPGTYYLNLQNAAVNTGDPIYWDENSGPSLAYESVLGSIPSESFDVAGGGPPPPPPCFDSGGKLQILYDFTGKEDGSTPSGVVADKAGHLYGTPSGGGDYGMGLVYELARKSAGWMFTPVYSFTGGNDGKSPSPVIVGPDQDLYGGAKQGYYGLVFNLRPSPTACRTSLCSWVENVLYRFTGITEASNGTVSAFDRAGNLYGTSISGGGGGTCSGSGCGTVFKLTPSGGSWSESILYSFTGGSDGSSPTQVLVGNDGNLYGTASGGTYGDGVVFQLEPSGSGWTQSVLHNFQWGTDGGYPGYLVQDSSGNLYGISQAYAPGRIFMLSRSGGDWAFSEFNTPYHGGGYEQLRNLTIDGAGNLYGTGGGGQGCLGDRCNMSPGSSPYAWAFIFKASYGADGWQYQDLAFFYNLDFLSLGALALDKQGNLYGTTFDCGAHGHGTVWQLSP